MKFCHMVMSSIGRILDCLCDPTDCVEGACLKWKGGKSDYVHVRVDGCVIPSDEENRKCDCLVLYSPAQCERTYVFLIEVKASSYGIDEVRGQLQEGRDAFNSAIQYEGEAPTVGVILSSLAGAPGGNGQVAEVMGRALSNIKKQNFTLIPVLYANKKIDLLKRVGRSDRFRINHGKKKIAIRFKNCGEDLLKGLVV